MEKIILHCDTLKNTNRETPNVNVHGVIGRVLPPKTFKGRTTQGVTIKDETGSIFASVATSSLTDANIGSDIEIDGAVWKSYTKKADNSIQWMLDAEKAQVRYQASVERPVNAQKKSRDDFDKEMALNMERYFDISLGVLNSPEMAKKLDDVKGLGWSSEDVRTLAISMFIENNRSRGLFK